MEQPDILAKLLLDDTFQAWVFSGGKEYAGYWQQWGQNHPEQAALLEKAKMTLLRLRADQYKLPEERSKALRQQLISLAQTDHPSIPAIGNQHGEKKNSLRWLSVAAAIVFLLIGGLAYLYVNDSSPQTAYQTAYGEIKTIVLPDSSQVTLNGNSSISYSEQASAESLREVWLEGEAFFEVSHIDHHTNEGKTQAVKFIVHTDNLSINVLGTRFNVKNRNEKTQVVLERGSIQLDIKDQSDTLLMQPDELVEVQKGEKLINQKRVEAKDYIAWKEGIIHFDGATFEEISNNLKDNYGLKLQFTDEEAAQQINLRGSFPTQNIDILLEAIANVTHTTMKKKGKTIIYH